MPSSYFTEDQEHKLLLLYRQGSNMRLIARLLGVNPSIVSRAIDRAAERERKGHSA